MFASSSIGVAVSGVARFGAWITSGGGASDGAHSTPASAACGTGSGSSSITETAAGALDKLSAVA
jgi:hypothetical protein